MKVINDNDDDNSDANGDDDDEAVLGRWYRGACVTEAGEIDDDDDGDDDGDDKWSKRGSRFISSVYVYKGFVVKKQKANVIGLRWRWDADDDDDIGDDEDREED